MRHQRAWLGFGFPLVLIPALVFFLGLGALALYWHIASGILEETATRWIEEQRGRGVLISDEGTQLSGFPFEAQLIFRNPSAQDLEQSWAWRADEVTLSAPLLRPGQYSLTFNTRHRVVLPGHTSGEEIEIDFGTGLVEASTDLEGVVEHVKVTASAVTILTLPQASPTTIDTVEVILSPYRQPPGGQSIEDKSEEQLNAEISIFGIQLAEHITAPLGSVIDRASLKLTLRPIPKAGALEHALATWRDQGGVVDISWMNLSWGALSVNGSGTATIDDVFRPLASFNLKANGYREALEASAEVGMIDAETARIAGLGLQVFTGLSGGGRTLAFPFTAQGKGLYLGPIRIGDNLPILRHNHQPTPTLAPTLAPIPKSTGSLEQGPEQTLVIELQPPPVVNWR